MTEQDSQAPGRFFMETTSTDVLIIGAGAAGIRAALAAAKEGAEVTVVSRRPVTRCGSSFSVLSGGWGIQALMENERTEESLEVFYNDVIQAGLGMADPKLVRILVEDSGPRIEDLLAHGLRFRKDPHGDYLRVRGCFSDYERAFLTENMNSIRSAFHSMFKASGAKTLIGTAAELIVLDGSCWGVWVVMPDQRIIRATAGATILATGGGAGLFQDHLATDQESGDGYALAYRAGAEMRNMEFIQFMLGMKGNAVRKFLPLSDLKRPGKLLDSNDRDILSEYIPSVEDRKRAIDERTKHRPFSTRDRSRLIDLALVQARRAGKRISWQNGNSEDKRLEVVHLAHAFNGGAAIDEKAETTVPGLFAAGEVAAGPHGADRIGGCMMTATQVFGERAGRFAANRALHVGSVADESLPPPFIGVLQSRGSADRRVSLLPELIPAREVFSREVSVLRRRRGLEDCLSAIEYARALLASKKKGGALSLIAGENILTTMELVTRASMRREESMGPHCREDVVFGPTSLPPRRARSTMRREPYGIETSGHCTNQ